MRRVLFWYDEVGFEVVFILEMVLGDPIAFFVVCDSSVEFFLALHLSPPEVHI